MKTVTLFTIPNCKWCQDAKEYLKKRNIRYTSVDVTKNKKALNDCKKSGCKGAPVLLIDKKWFCKFDKNIINKELGIK